MSIRVLIADDQEMVRDGFRMILESEEGIHVAAEARDGLEAVDAAAGARPDIVLMDIRMPGIDGIEATRRIVERIGDRTRVLMLTTFGLDEYVFESLRVGASGFLLKDAPPEELVAAIRTIAAGDALLSPTVTRSVIEEFAHRSPSAKDSGVEDLTPREREVFDLLTEGLSNAEIAARLALSDSTVKTHVANVLHKLGVRDRTQLVIRAYETGLVRRHEEAGGEGG